MSTVFVRYVVTIPLGWLLYASAAAADISQSIRSGAAGPFSGDGGYLDIGLAAARQNYPYLGFPYTRDDGSHENFVVLVLNGRYQFRGLFIEAFSESVHDLTLGYNLGNTQTWALDIIGSWQHLDIKAETLPGLEEREEDFLVGLRGTGYFGNYLLQVQALTDASNTHGGGTAAAYLGRFWRWRNWNFHSIGGLSYRSQSATDYYLSIREQEVSEHLAPYTASSGFTYLVEAGVAYPISERWVFRGLARHEQLERDWRDSPLVVAGRANLLSLSLNYVF